MQISTKELRTCTRELFNAIERGEDVILTYRGEAKARVCPLTERVGEGVGPHPAFAMWKDREEDVEEQVRDLRKGRFPC